MISKPKHETGYNSAETELVASAILTVFSRLGDLSSDLVIVGGIAPRLLIDLNRENASDGQHCGSNDLDLGLALAVLDAERYKEISKGLRDMKFEPSRNADGNLQFQKWIEPSTGIEIDFLLPNTTDTEVGKIKKLERDFGALSTRALSLAFEDVEKVELVGQTLLGHRITRTVNVVGPAAFLILKSFALANRSEPKDAYDIDYVLANWPLGIDDISQRARALLEVSQQDVEGCLDILERDYETIDHQGPRLRASFSAGDPEVLAADALGRVLDFVERVRQ